MSNAERTRVILLANYNIFEQHMFLLTHVCAKCRTLSTTA